MLFGSRPQPDQTQNPFLDKPKSEEKQQKRGVFHSDDNSLNQLFKSPFQPPNSNQFLVPQEKSVQQGNKWEAKKIKQ